MSAGKPAVRRWPLILIAAPAAVAIWSGWVGLGQMCGFGVVQLLPGIADGFRLNTAITLPVGVEAYGAYALGAWMRPGGVPEDARAFARRSAAGALALGMTGQVIYHLLAAAHATRAPWPVTVLVSCLPVVVLGFGAALTHLLRAGETGPEPEPEPVPDAAPETAPEPWPAPEPQAAQVPAPEPEPVPSSAEQAAESSMRATLAAGNPWSANALATRFGLTRKTATDVRERVLAETGRADEPDLAGAGA